MGIGFFIAGLANGMVSDALSSLMSNTPDVAKALPALGLWGLATFGSLGLGSFGIKYYGVRDSIMGFGAILMLCGGIGLYVALTGGGTSNSGNVIWVVMNMVAEYTGSLLITSLIALGIGILLFVFTLLLGSGSEAPRKQVVLRKTTDEPAPTIPPGKGKVCSQCGYANANWYVSCEKCGSMLPRSTGYHW
jgi:hypothetical protein